MKAYNTGPCCACGGTIKQGDECDYDRSAKKKRHFNCPDSRFPVKAKGEADSPSPSEASAAQTPGRDNHFDRQMQLATDLGFIRYEQGMSSDGIIASMQRRMGK